MPRVLASRARLELLLVLALFGASSWWGAHYVERWRESGRAQLFYQEYFEPAVMMACGRGFGVAASPAPPELGAFLRQEADGFDCALLPADMVVTTEGDMQGGWYHLMATVAVAWMVLGVSWSGLTPLFGLFFGVVIVLAYGLLRVAVPVPFALAASVALSASSLHLQNLPHLRDYSKAPFILALLLILFWFVRRPLAPRTFLVLAALYGAVLGVGYGFRSDLLAYIPPLVVTVALFLPGGLRSGLGLKAAALVLAAVAFVGASWPATRYVVRRGACHWHVVLLGFDESFDRALRIESPFYQWTNRYSDELMHTTVVSYSHRMFGTGPLGYCSPEHDVAGAAYFMEIARRFPADLLTRAYASVLRVLDLPFFYWHVDPDGIDEDQRSDVGRALTWVAGTARAAVVLSVLLLGAWRLRVGLFAVCVVLYFGGYPSLQFAARHLFHLEFIGWWGLAFLAWQGWRFWREGAGALPSGARPWSRFAARAGVFALMVLLPLATLLGSLRLYQDHEVDLLVRSLLAAPRVEVPLAPAADGHGLALPDAGLRVDRDDPMQTAYLDVQIDLARCPAGIDVSPLYDPGIPFYDFSGPLPARPRGTTPSRVLFPAYRFFRGLSLARGGAECVTRVEQVASVAGVPLLPILTLPPDWTALPHHQSLGRVQWWP